MYYVLVCFENQMNHFLNKFDFLSAQGPRCAYDIIMKACAVVFEVSYVCRVGVFES